jgi:hypothetical protein
VLAPLLVIIIHKHVPLLKCMLLLFELGQPHLQGIGVVRSPVVNTVSFAEKVCIRLICHILIGAAVLISKLFILGTFVPARILVISLGLSCTVLSPCANITAWAGH